MNTIGLLLVLGLAFYALKQGSQKTRNMLLVASALLGFCMFSAEGFTSVILDGASATAQNSALDPGGTVTSPEGGTYTFPAGWDPATGDDPTWTCDGDTIKAPLATEPLVAAAKAIAADLTATNINSVFPCLDKEQCTRATPALKAMCPGGATKAKTDSSSYCAGAACANTDFTGENPVCCTALTQGTSVCPAKETAAAAIKTQNDTCGDYKKYKTTGTTATTYTGVAGITSPTYLTNCCEDNCTTDKCDKWNLFGLTCSDCEACEEGDFLDTYCSDPDFDTITYLVWFFIILLIVVAILAVGAKIAKKSG